jgi:hypothetical protein
MVLVVTDFDFCHAVYEGLVQNLTENLAVCFEKSGNVAHWFFHNLFLYRYFPRAFMSCFRTTFSYYCYLINWVQKSDHKNDTFLAKFMIPFTTF